MQNHYEELTRIFKLSLYGMSMMASLILGIAENSWLPYGTLFMAALGYLATESPGHFALNQIVSNLLGMLAIGLSGIEFFSDNPEGKLLAGTHLVVYATWLVFLQKSNVRKYWSICALSVLQVAVASVLTTQSWYGGTLIVFSIIAIWTLAVFSLYYAVEQYRALTPAIAVSSVDSFRFNSAISEAGHEIQLDSHGQWINLRFMGGVSVLAALALTLSAVFYVLTPRVWIGQRYSFNQTVEESVPLFRNLTGFTPNVKLGELGEILESMERVMTVQVIDRRNGKDRPLSAEEFAEIMGYDEPLFRGGTMLSYENGNWDTDLSEDSHDSLRTNPGYSDFLQKIDLEPVAGEILFSFGTPVACDILSKKNPRAEVSQLTGTFVQRSRRGKESSGEIRYLVYSNLPRKTPDGIPRVEVRLSMNLLITFERYLTQCLQLPKNSLPRLTALARSLQAEEAKKLGREPTNLEMARRLESYLRDSGQFGYTMKLDRQDASIDPVEDFLFNRKTGHCEYFASALALMLRAVDIPSRVMNGFKGGETNYRGHIEVQQRHAHAWVEAWADDGTWLVLDPTPIARAESIKEVGKTKSFTQSLANSASSLWTDWVTNFSPEQQQEGLYRPIQALLLKIWAQLLDLADQGPANLTWFWKFLTHPREWFSLTGLFFVGVFTVLYYILKWMVRKTLRWWRWFQDPDRNRDKHGIVIPFYARFVELLKARGTVRTTDQTQAEFAKQVFNRFGDPLTQLGAEQAPDLITSLYYRVRFGDVPLSPDELSQVNHALQQIEHLTKATSPSGR